MQQYLDLIQSAYPELEIKAARAIVGAGQFSTVLVIDEALIFRFPRSDEIAISMARETALLKKLQGRVRLPIPNPIYDKSDPQTGAQILMGYRMLEGEPMPWGALDAASDADIRRAAADLGGFLHDLHAVPLDVLEMRLESEGGRDEWTAMYDDFRRELYPHMRPDAQEQVTYTFEHALENASLWAFKPVLRHGDLGTGNILYDAGECTISGVIDFGMAGLGDPAQEVGALWSLGDRFMGHFFEFYPEMRVTIPRVKFIRSTYALQQALWAQRMGDQEEFEDGIRDYI